MSRHKVTYKGELIVAGELAGAGFAFWRGVKPAPEFDMGAVRDRLDRIRFEDGVHHEVGADRILFPPAFSVEPDDALPSAPRPATNGDIR